MIPELAASKVAGFIGLHKYQNPDEILYELLLKDTNAKQRILAIQTEHNRKAYSKVVQDILQDTTIRDCISSGIEAAKRTTDVTSVLEDVQQQATTVLTLRHTSIPAELRDRLADEVRGKVSKQRGLDNEEKILNTYEAAREVKVTERNTKTIRKDCGSYRLVGRCDGYVADQQRIVDSKDRTRVWPSVPIYDEIQLRCYMQMYDAKDSELIERFPDKTTRHTLYTNDPEKWKSIHDLIERGVQKLHNILEDNELLKRIVFLNTVEIHNERGNHV